MMRFRLASVLFAALLATSALAACGDDEPEAARAETVTVPSPSMEPTFTKGQVVTLSPVPSVLEVGMIVVFKDPSGWLDADDGNGKVIKRVLGTSGDRVACCDAAGLVTINGAARDETAYLPVGVRASDQPFDVTVPAGKLWVMGDNRSDSADSRAHLGDPGGGFVDEGLVLGIVSP